MQFQTLPNTQIIDRSIFQGGRYIHSKPDMKPFLYCPSIHKYANKKNPLEEWQTFQRQFPQMVSSVEWWQQLNSFFLLSFVLFPYVYACFLYSLKTKQVMFCPRFFNLIIFFCIFLKGSFIIPLKSDSFPPKQFPLLSCQRWTEEGEKTNNHSKLHKSFSLKTNLDIFPQNRPRHFSVILTSCNYFLRHEVL